jgi:hypothetical protein
MTDRYAVSGRSGRSRAGSEALSPSPATEGMNGERRYRRCVLMTVQREWPWGLVVFGDPQDRDALPTSLGPNGIARTAATIVTCIQHAVDGPATASVSMGPEPSGLLLIHEGELHLLVGRLRLADAAAEESHEVAVAAGKYEVRVLMDEREQPSKVHFALRYIG